MTETFPPTTPGLWAKLAFLLHFNIECSRQCARFPVQDTNLSHKWLKSLAYTKIIIHKQDSLPPIHTVGALYLSLQEQRTQKESSSHYIFRWQFIWIFKGQSTDTKLTVATQFVMLRSALKVSRLDFTREYAYVSILFYEVRLSCGSRKDKML